MPPVAPITMSNAIRYRLARGRDAQWFCSGHETHD